MNQTISTNLVKALSHFATKNRESLNGISIKNGKAYAADGFILGRATVNTNGFEGRLETKPLLDLAKTVKHCQELHLVTEIAEPRAVAMGDTANWGPLTAHEYQFPNAEAIMPQPKDTDRTIYVSPVLLGQLVNAAKAVDANMIQLTIQEEPNFKPIRFELRNGRDALDGALMPLAPPRD